MRHQQAFVDDPLAAHGYNSGDVVRKSDIRDFVLTPFPGRVVYSNVETGKVMVQWPWGQELEDATELVKDTSGDFAAPEFDHGYSTWERARHENSKETLKEDKKWRKSLASVVADKYENKTLPLWRAACEAVYCGMSEMDAFMGMREVFATEYGDDAVRLTVSNLYNLGRRMAVYWADPKRRYKTTQKERASGVFTCPRCKSELAARTYRQGRKVLNCRGCGFSLDPRDLLVKK